MRCSGFRRDLYQVLQGFLVRNTPKYDLFVYVGSIGFKESALDIISHDRLPSCPLETQA